jgi:hypothetical protein
MLAKDAVIIEQHSYFVRKRGKTLWPDPLKKSDVWNIADGLVNTSTKLSHTSFLEGSSGFLY